MSPLYDVSARWCLYCCGCISSSSSAAWKGSRLLWTWCPQRGAPPMYLVGRSHQRLDARSPLHFYFCYCHHLLISTMHPWCPIAPSNAIPHHSPRRRSSLFQPPSTATPHRCPHCTCKFTTRHSPIPHRCGCVSQSHVQATS